MRSVFIEGRWQVSRVSCFYLFICMYRALYVCGVFANVCLALVGVVYSVWLCLQPVHLFHLVRPGVLVPAVWHKTTVQLAVLFELTA